MKKKEASYLKSNQASLDQDVFNLTNDDTVEKLASLGSKDTKKSKHSELNTSRTRGIDGSDLSRTFTLD